MEINKYMEAALKLISEHQLDVKKSYKLQRSMEAFGKFQLLKPTYITQDSEVNYGNVTVPVRIFYPNNKTDITDVIIFFHGGGWVTGDIDSYNRVCAVTSRKTGCRVASVDYRLAPEHKFPQGLTDCYEVAKYYFQNSDEIFGVTSDRLIIMGDSAGGNLAAAVSQMARDKCEFMPKRQVLFYPATNSDHSESSPYESVRTNGKDYVLTAKQVCDYMELYTSSPEDKDNPYFAPIKAKNFSDQPDTLIITAEFDPLRDEGEAYGIKLKRAGSRVEIFRMKQAIHGFLSMPAGMSQVKKSYELLNDFLEGEKHGEVEEEYSVAET